MRWSVEILLSSKSSNMQESRSTLKLLTINIATNKANNNRCTLLHYKSSPKNLRNMKVGKSWHINIKPLRCLQQQQIWFSGLDIQCVKPCGQRVGHWRTVTTGVWTVHCRQQKPAWFFAWVGCKGLAAEASSAGSFASHFLGYIFFVEMNYGGSRGPCHICHVFLEIGMACNVGKTKTPPTADGRFWPRLTSWHRKTLWHLVGWWFSPRYVQLTSILCGCGHVLVFFSHSRYSCCWNWRC